MGAILGAFSLASWVPCLCSGASCLLCSCGPVSENPTVTPLIYASMLILGTFTSCIMMTEGVQTQLKKIPGFCDGRFQIKTIDTKAEKECDVLVGFKAVYRISFAVAIFFFAFFLLKLKVKTSKDPRAAVHNGFWFFKITAIIGIMVASFYIPGDHFTKVWFGAGMLGATFFIFIQLVLLVDVAHSRNESWVNRTEEGNPRLWYAALLPFTTLLYILSIVFAVLLYIFYTKPDGCTEKKVFISPNLVFCVAVSIVSILPKVQEHQPHSGLLQSSIIAVQTLYLTWSAMTNEPERSCNPSLMGIITHLISPTVSSANSTTLAPACAPPPQNGHFMNLDDIWGLIIFVFCLIYSSICTLSNNQVNKLTLSGSDSVILADTTSGASDEDGTASLGCRQREGGGTG